jgi:hypothetical protein
MYSWGGGGDGGGEKGGVLSHKKSSRNVREGGTSIVAGGRGKMARKWVKRFQRVRYLTQEP